MPGPGAHGGPVVSRHKMGASSAAGGGRNGTGGGGGGSFGRGKGHELYGVGAWEVDEEDGSPGPGAYGSATAQSSFRQSASGDRRVAGWGRAGGRFESAEERAQAALPGPGTYDAARALKNMHRIPG